MGTRWRGMLAPLGVPTGDGRRFLVSGVTYRELPLPLSWQRSNEPGHDTAVVVGLIDTLTIDDQAVWAEGELFDDVSRDDMPTLAQDVAEAIHLTAKRVVGPSVDPGSVEAVVVAQGSDEPLTDEDLERLYWDEIETGEPARVETLFTRYEIAGATLVPTPAFAECLPFELLTVAITAAVRTTGWDDLPLADRALEWDVDQAKARLADQAGLDTDEPDWDLYASSFLHRDEDADPQTRGAYGFCIVDVIDGERHVVPRAVFAVAGTLQGSRDGTTISQADQDTMRGVVTGIYERMAREFDDPGIVAPWVEGRAAIVAATLGPPRAYDLSAFDRPALSEITPITVVDDPDGGPRRIVGHIATHDTCHVGHRDVCLTAPVDTSGFSWFHRSHLPTGDGQTIDVGRLTYGAGQHKSCSCCGRNDDHACVSLSLAQAIAHHDAMRTLAWVRAWEDHENHAIAVAGVLADDVTDDELAALGRRKVSGDWRPVAGRLELAEILVLARETEGLPLPHARMAGRSPMALVAAGTVRSAPPTTGITIDYDRIVTEVTSGVVTALRSLHPDRDDIPDPTSDPLEAEASAVLGQIDQTFATLASTEAARLRQEIGDVLR